MSTAEIVMFVGCPVHGDRWVDPGGPACDACEGLRDVAAVNAKIGEHGRTCRTCAVGQVVS